MSVALNSDEFIPGGGGARNSAALDKKNGRIAANCGPSGGVGGCVRLGHLPSPVGSVPDKGRWHGPL